MCPQQRETKKTTSTAAWSYANSPRHLLNTATSTSSRRRDMGFGRRQRAAGLSFAFHLEMKSLFSTCRNKTSRKKNRKTMNLPTGWKSKTPAVQVSPNTWCNVSPVDDPSALSISFWDWKFCRGSLLPFSLPLPSSHKQAQETPGFYTHTGGESASQNEKEKCKFIYDTVYIMLCKLFKNRKGMQTFGQ